MGRWDYGGTVAHQCGDFGKDQIDAWGANARVGHTFEAPWKPRIAAEFSYASGDSNPRDGRRETFDGVFGAIDTFYGRMNFLSWMNLEDYQITFGLQPTKTLKVWMDYHVFRLASDRDGWYWCNGRAARRDVTGETSPSLGQEIDVLFQWQINKHLELFVGYCHFFPGPFIRDTPGTDRHADWVFVQVTFQF